MIEYEAVNLGSNCWSVIKTEEGVSTVLAVTSNTNEIPPWPMGPGGDFELAKAWAERIAAALRIAQL